MSAALDPSIRRRTFLAAVGTSVAAYGCQEAAAPDAEQEGPAMNEGVGTGTMPMRELGSTGVRTSAIGLGGFHLGKPDEQEAIRIVHRAIDRGITFLDNCWDYNEGKSEERMGAALADGYRDKVYLMTKIDGRTKAAATAQLEQSLRRLRTDVIDLLQIHEIIRPDDPATCFAPGGCIEALEEARRAGKIRHVGFTGHKDPEYHLAMLAEADKHGFRFDAVQMPLNVLDAHFKSFEKRVLPVLVEKKIAVLGMKALAAGKIVESKAASAEECLRYALSLPTSVVITGCDSMKILDQATRVATTFQPMKDEERTALLERTRAAAQGGTLEEFKISNKHDGTEQNKKWLTTAEL